MSAKVRFITDSLSSRPACAAARYLGATKLRIFTESWHRNGSMLLDAHTSTAGYSREARLRTALQPNGRLLECPLSAHWPDGHCRTHSIYEYPPTDIFFMVFVSYKPQLAAASRHSLLSSSCAQALGVTIVTCAPTCGSGQGCNTAKQRKRMCGREGACHSTVQYSTVEL